MPDARIISVGSINLDVQVRAEHWPGKGESGLASDCLLVSGGKAANVAYLARRLGTAAQLVTRVGDGPMVEHVLQPLREIGVDLSEVRRTSDCLTGVSMIMTPRDGRKSILLAPNANRAWNAEDAGSVAAIISGAPKGSVVVVDFEISALIAARTVEAAQVAGLQVVIDPAPPSDVPASALRQAHYVTPDASEARQLTGIEVGDPESGLAAAEELLRRGVQVALVKLSAGGCVLASDSLRAHIETHRVQPTDATGAGDAFAAALAVAVLEGEPPIEAARRAVAAATIATTRYGSQASYPDREELQEFLPRTRVARQFEAPL